MSIPSRPASVSSSGGPRGGWFYLAPVVWMSLGGAGVFFWNVRSPQKNVRPPSSLVKNRTLLPREGGLFCVDPPSLPQVPVLHIVDGDTVEILWEGAPRILRYYGVDTTERDQPCYEEGRARNRALCGGSLRLAFDDRLTDPHGRLLAYVFTNEGLSVDAQLVAEGLGRAWRRDGRLRGSIETLEDEARSVKRGCLWSGEPVAPVHKRRSRR